MQNFDDKAKLSVCLLCWGFITFYQKRRHQEHSHYTVTPTYFKSEATFMQLAKTHGKIQQRSDGSTMVAIFADQCRIVESTYINSPARALSFGAQNQGKGYGNAAVHEIRQVGVKQNEHEQQFKRLNQIITAMYEESKAKEKRIKDLEDQLTSIQQMICQQNTKAARGPPGIKKAIQPPKPQQKKNSESDSDS